MGRKPKYNKEEKLEIVKRYLNGESATLLAEQFNINAKIRGDKQIRVWVKKYEKWGETVFDSKGRNKRYSKELKLKAINEYLEGNGSLETIANKYQISSIGILGKWIMKYNSHIEIKDYDPKPEVYMAKSRKTSYEERIEIVNYCIEHNNNYKETAFKYGVNYAQVFSWVKKYKHEGKESLLDRRGRKKHESEMTSEEKLKHEIKKLEAKNAYLEMENKALKKLEEIERRMVKDKHKK